MKVFTKDNSAWETKINFVDQNNILVGFDMGGQCCEQFGCFVSDEIYKCEELPKCGTDVQESEVEGFDFNTNFFLRNEINGVDFAIFKLSKFAEKGYQIKYLHLFNCQNGYYSHGFTCEVGGQTIYSGEI